MSAGDAQESTGASMAAQAFKDPKIMQAIQEKLAGLEGMRSTFYDALPKKIKGRVNACRNIQKEFVNHEAEFYREINQLERKYNQKFGDLYNRRSQIISGKYEPINEETIHSGDEDEQDAEEKKQRSNEMNGDAEMHDQEIKLPSAFPDDAIGVPEFWLTVMKSASHTDAMIEAHDEPLLKNLNDVKLSYETLETDNPDTIGFTLEFHFSDNEFFENSLLTKTYRLRMKPDAEAPLAYEGPEIVQAIGCDIGWRTKASNVTVKIIKKKQKNKKSGQTRTITQEVPQDSFFNFFQPIEAKVENLRKHLAAEDMDEDEDEYDQQAAMLEADYEIGHFIRERLIPRAVLYYTGELDDEDSEYGEEGSDDDDDDEYDEDADADYDPTKGGQKPAECKQQ